MRAGKEPVIHHLYDEYLRAYVKVGAGEAVLLDRHANTSELAAMAWGIYDARCNRDPCNLDRFGQVLATADTKYQAESG